MVALLPWLGDALVVFGLSVLTLAVAGMLRLDDFRLRLHAASLVGVLGTLPLLLATVASLDMALIGRSLLVGCFLILTAPVSVHALIRAAHAEDAGENAAGAPSESGRPRSKHQGGDP